MSIPKLIAVIAIAAVPGGCAFPGPVAQTRVATIQRIEERPGEYYSVFKGREPLFCIHLDVLGPSRGGGPEKILILVLGPYEPAVHGRVGDRVLLGWSGNLPWNGEIDFDALSSYRVVTGNAGGRPVRAPAAGQPGHSAPTLGRPSVPFM